MWRRLCGVQGARQPTSPPGDTRILPLGWACDLVADAESEAEALVLLPRYVAERTSVSRVDEVEIP
jgi:hypothetical protein